MMESKVPATAGPVWHSISSRLETICWQKETDKGCKLHKERLRHKLGSSLFRFALLCIAGLVRHENPLHKSTCAGFATQEAVAHDTGQKALSLASPPARLLQGACVHHLRPKTISTYIWEAKGTGAHRMQASVARFVSCPCPHLLALSRSRPKKSLTLPPKSTFQNDMICIATASQNSAESAIVLGAGWEGGPPREHFWLGELTCRD
jgi:hypothetical protein